MNHDGADKIPSNYFNDDGAVSGKQPDWEIIKVLQSKRFKPCFHPFLAALDA